MSNDNASIVSSLTGEVISDEKLKTIAEIAERQHRIEEEIARIEAALEMAKELQRLLSEERLPAAMLEVGLEEFKLSNGTKVTITKFYNGKIAPENEALAFNWLRENQHDSIIKREIKVPFGKGEDKAAEALKKKLEKLKISFTDKQGVHPQTLKAFIREQVESAKPLPMDLFGVYIGNRAKVTPAKE
jgi:hypothetical protein